MMFTCKCDCCLTEKPLQFITPRLRICKECIITLNESELCPNEIIDSYIVLCQPSFTPLQDEFDTLLRSKLPVPTFHEPSSDQIFSDALKKAKQEETFWQSLYRTIINERERLVRVAQIAFDIRANFAQEKERMLSKHRTREAHIEADLRQLQIVWNTLMDTIVREAFDYYDKSLRQGIKSLESLTLRAFSLNLMDYRRDGVRLELTSTEWTELAKSVRKEDKQKCVVCAVFRSGIKLHVHHVIHIAHGGTNCKENLATLCPECHCEEHPHMKNNCLR